MRIPFDALLVAVGRTANLNGYGLEELGIPPAAHSGQWLPADEFPEHLCRRRCRRSLPVHPYGGPSGLVRRRQRAFRPTQEVPRRLSVIPWATFVDPEVARVGLNEIEAKERGTPYELTVYGIDDLDRAIADGEAHGFVKMLTVPDKDRILGVTIVGEHAADLIAEFVLAMRHGIGLNKIFGTIHTYPTWPRPNKYAAGCWKQAHAPQTLLRWVGAFTPGGAVPRGACEPIDLSSHLRPGAVITSTHDHWEAL